MVNGSILQGNQLFFGLLIQLRSIFSSPGRSPGRAIVLPPALASALVAAALAKC